MPNPQFFGIVLIAMVAGVILFRLYTVLGRRTGNEREANDRFQRIGADAAKKPDNVIPLPNAQRPPDASDASDPVKRALIDIKLADRGFETDHFIAGAKQAYEMIVAAFARGDRDALRKLIAADVYHAFEHAIGDRESKKLKVEFTFVGFKAAKIVHAALKDRTAEITMSFLAQFLSATRDESGAVVEGDPKEVREVTDVWSFARDTASRDPNWMLVATSGTAPDASGH
ncbi:MAG TPA: Tim44/TimA family putative adaptor protein [Rhizomicrobium sp.]|jgi:predicted lipid-binding transport protein (Tim44 family)